MQNTSLKHICGYNTRVRVSQITAGRQPASLSRRRAPTEVHDQIHHVSVRRPRVLIFWSPAPTNEKVGLVIVVSHSVCVFVYYLHTYMHNYTCGSRV